MGRLREETPQEFSDDVRWYKYFSQRLFGTLLIEGVLCFLLCRILMAIHLLIVGIIISVVVVAGTIILMSVPVPGDDIMRGAGMKLEEYVYRRYKKKKNRAVYIRVEETEETI